MSAIANRTRVSVLVQLAVCACESPKTRQKRPPVPRIVPGTSRCASSSPRTFCSSISAPAKATFTNRHQRQERYWVRMPPSSRLTAAPEPATAPKTPKALPRSCGSVKVTVRSERAAGARIAPNSPCTPRATTRTAKDGAGPPAAGGVRKPIHPADEGPLAAEDVGDPATQQEQRAEGQRVGGDDPLPGAFREAERFLGRGQGDVDDGRGEP